MLSNTSDARLPSISSRTGQAESNILPPGGATYQNYTVVPLFICWLPLYRPLTSYPNSHRMTVSISYGPMFCGLDCGTMIVCSLSR